MKYINTGLVAAVRFSCFFYHGGQAEVAALL
jgi:hypothetical protein